MKNKLILLLVRFLRLFLRHSPTDKKRILVISSTALGDTLWGAPALESLRKSFPDAYIALLTSPIGEQALRHNSWVDRTYLLIEPMLPRFWGLWRKLRSEKFTDVVILHASQRLVLPLAALVGASRIVATAKINKGLDSLLTDSIPSCIEHEIVRRLGLIEKIGAKRHSEMLSFFLQPEEMTDAPKIISGMIALHPGSKDRFKRWPAEHFVAVGNALRKMGRKILITGTKEEEPLMRTIAEQIEGAEMAPTTLSLRKFAALLQQVDLLISNDTGPVHLACALQLPVIALYSSTNPQLCGPHLAKNAVALFKRPSCVPCLKRKCHRPFCLLQIGPEEVVNSAKEMLCLKQ